MLAIEIGEKIQTVLDNFIKDLSSAKFIVGHNLNFDINVVSSELYRLGIENELLNKNILDTCTENTANIWKLPGGKSGNLSSQHLWKLMKTFSIKSLKMHTILLQIYNYFLNLFDKLCNPTLIDDLYLKVSTKFSSKVPNFKVVHLNLKEESKKLKEQNQTLHADGENLGTTDLKSDYVHLHNNSQFSVLQSTIKISDIVKKTAEFKMNAVALTDKANMMGCFHFYKAVKNHNDSVTNQKEKIKPILGCELNVCEDRLDKSYRDDGYQVVFLLKINWDMKIS